MSEIVSAREALARLSDEHLAADAAFAAELDDAGRQRLAALADGLRGLPESGQLALLLRELEGRGYEEIGEIAGLTPVEARREVFRARLQLQGDPEPPTEHCNQVRAAMSRDESNVHDRAPIEAHMESCEVCSSFAAALESRPADLKLLFATGTAGAEVAATAAGAATATATAAAAAEEPGDEGAREPVEEAAAAEPAAEEKEAAGKDGEGPGRRRRALGVPVAIAAVLIGGGVALAVVLSGGGGEKKPAAVTSHVRPGSKQAPSGGPGAAHRRRAHRAHRAHKLVSPSALATTHHRRVGGAERESFLASNPSQSGYSTRGASVEQQVDASRADPRSRGGDDLPLTGLDLMLVVAAALVLVGVGLSIRQLANPR